MSTITDPLVEIESGILTDMGRRRFQQTGSLSERSGSWLLRWREDGIDPKTGEIIREERSQVIAKSKGPGAITRRKAQAVAREAVLDRVNAGVNTPAASITVESFARGRFQSGHIDGLKASGREHYAYILDKHVLPTLGGYRLREVTPLLVQSLISAKRKARLSSQTLAHIRNVVSSIFRRAREWQLYPPLQLPTEGIRIRVESQERGTVTAEQAAKLIASLPGQYGTLVALLVTTGLRIGEAAGLTWKRVDFAGGRLTVSEQFSKGRWVRSPKSKAGARVVPVPEAILKSIAALKQRRTHLGPDDPVFVSKYGNPIGSHIVAAKILKPAAKALGMPWVCWHSFRHSNATLADQQGASVAIRRKIMGHNSDALAMRYTHPDVEGARTVVEGIAAALEAAGKARVM